MITARQQTPALHLRTRIETGGTAAGLEPARLPASLWCDPAYHARELTVLFDPTPRPVALVSDLAAPGDFVTARLGRLPVVVVRDEDRRIRAFVNVCRHRGARLVAERRGRVERLICPFHGWCFRLDGALDEVPGQGAFGAVERAEHGLLARPVALRHGLVWVHPLPGTGLDVCAELSPALDEELSGLGLAGYTLDHEERFEVKANWKLVTDGLLRTRHGGDRQWRSAAAGSVSSMSAIAAMGRHLRMALPGQPGDGMESQPSDGGRAPAQLSIVYVLVPGGVIRWQAGRLQVFLVEPDVGRPDRCAVRLCVLVPGRRAAQTERWPPYPARTIHGIAGEAFARAEVIQHGFASGAIPEALIRRAEPGTALFYACVDRLVGEGGDTT